MLILKNYLAKLFNYFKIYIQCLKETAPFAKIHLNCNIERHSLMERLSWIWNKIQRLLFPELEDVLGPLTDKQQKLIAILELARIEDLVSNNYKGIGRYKKDRRAIARAFIVKAVYNISTTRNLIEQLNSSPNLRRICGWEKKSDIPHESAFSRAFSEFTEMKLTEITHQILIEKYQSEKLVGHISRDSTDIKGREKPAKKEKNTKKKAKRKRGRPKKGEKPLPKEPTRLEQQFTMTKEDMLAELPKDCDRGCKKNSKGYIVSWNGFKLHIDCADGEIPISCILTSASVHDSQVAIPLAEITSERVVNLYDLMDSAYDAALIKMHSISLGHVPIIDCNQRRGEDAQMDPAKKLRYNERSTVERAFGRLKEEFGANFVRVRGHAKVFTHLMFGVLALTADQLLRLVM